MDPLTAALNFASAAIAFAAKVWDATPPALQQQAAADWAKFGHNISAFVLSVQEQVNKAVK